MEINVLDWLEEGPATLEEVMSRIDREGHHKDVFSPNGVRLLLNLAVNRGFALRDKQ